MNFLKKLFNTKTTITTTLTVTSSNGFHLRPIAKFVNEAKKFDATITLKAKEEEVSATQVPKILSLSLEKGDSFELRCKGKEAQEASKELSKLFKELMSDDKEVKEIKQEEEQYEASSLRGETIAKGIGIAPLIELIYQVIDNDSNVPLSNAIDMSISGLEEMYEKHKEEDNADIYLAQMQLLQTDIFMNLKDEEPSKFQELIQIEIDKLKNTKFESRISDYRDIEQRVLSEMGIYKEFKTPDNPYILFTDDLLPSDIALLKDTPVQGVILEKGTTLSHASILLRSANIPSMIIQNENLKSNSLDVILDANSGNLILEPTKNDLKEARERQDKLKKEQEQSFQKRFETTKTKSGKEVKVLANITDLDSAKEAKELGADGVGLLRTEFLFTKNKPSVEEQTQTYQAIFELFNEVTVRTLDIGGDKSLPYIDIPKEENPFLGLRGIRFSLQEQTLFKEQLLAIFKAVGSISSNKKTIKIMFPMISNIEEFTEAKNIAQTVAKENNLNISNIQFGIMLEVPSIIFGLKEFNNLVDFYSIGSNDLTQYLFAIERTHPTLSVDPISPLLLLALEQIRKDVKKPISICGELAGLDVATQKLLSMNYTTLSVSAKLIPNLKERIRNV